MTARSLHHGGYRVTTIRPAKKEILRAHLTALARRLHGPGLPGGYHRNLAVSILQSRRRAAGR